MAAVSEWIGTEPAATAVILTYLSSNSYSAGGHVQHPAMQNKQVCDMSVRVTGRLFRGKMVSFRIRAQHFSRRIIPELPCKLTRFLVVQNNEDSK